MMLRTLRDIMLQIGFENVDEAIDGGSAFQLMQSKTYGLLVSDWSMLPVSGIELLRNVRADPKLKAIPFIIVSAEGSTENVSLARDAGVSAYVVKPFRRESLRATILKTLGES